MKTNACHVCDFIIGIAILLSDCIVTLSSVVQIASGSTTNNMSHDIFRYVQNKRANQYI